MRVFSKQTSEKK